MSSERQGANIQRLLRIVRHRMVARAEREIIPWPAQSHSCRFA